MQREIIRYLGKEERKRTRSLYEECFPEDSASFVDYYYQEKIRNNQILVMEQPGQAQAGASQWPQVMLHLNPFLFQFGEERQLLNYIVAVATAPSARKQGNMSRVMERALKDLAAQGQPFTFLIPANPKVYESSSFAFVPMEVGEDSWGNEAGSFRPRPAKSGDIPRLVECANRWLAGRYDAFPVRSQEYFGRFFQELRAQEGGVLTVEDTEGELVGIAAYGREGADGELQQLLARPGDKMAVEEAVRQYLAREGIEQLAETEMPFMVRILDLSRLLRLMGSSCREELCLRVKLRDRILRENNGAFELYCREGVGGLCRIPEDKAEWETDIAGLVRELFGKKIRLYIREWV